MSDFLILTGILLGFGFIAFVLFTGLMHRTATLNHPRTFVRCGIIQFLREFTKHNWEQDGTETALISANTSRLGNHLITFSDLNMLLPVSKYWVVEICLRLYIAMTGRSNEMKSPFDIPPDDAE